MREKTSIKNSEYIAPFDFRMKYKQKLEQLKTFKDLTDK